MWHKLWHLIMWLWYDTFLHSFLCSKSKKKKKKKRNINNDLAILPSHDISFVMLLFISCCVYVCNVRMSKLRYYISCKVSLFSWPLRNMYSVWHKVMWTIKVFYFWSNVLYIWRKYEKYYELYSPGPSIGRNYTVLVQTSPGSPLACLLDTIEWL